MVMITISQDALQRALGKEISVDEISRVLFDMGMELKDEDEGMLSVEVTAERLDLVSVHGLARAISSSLGLSRQAPRYAVSKSEYTVNVTNKVKDVRPYTVSAVIKGLELDDERVKEIIEVQEKLHSTIARNRKRGAIGIHPLDTITMPITYTADAPKKIVFTPLEAEKEMDGATILEQHDIGMAYKHLLEGKKQYPYFVDSKGEILSMPPIINSQKAGKVDSSTKDLFIECSGFDKNILNELLVNITTMFADMEGKIFSVNVVYPDGSTDVTPDLSVKRRTLSNASIKRYFGVDFSEKEVMKLLSRMMYTVKDSVKDERGELTWAVEAPPFRSDICHEVDIIDDIARAHGFNNFTSGHPDIPGIGGMLDKSRIREEIASEMVGLGFLETFTFSITEETSQFKNMRIEPAEESYVPIANGNENQTMLRTRLIHEQLKCLANNRSRPLPQRIFEAAFVTLPDEKRDVKAKNELRLSGLMTDKVVTFTEIRQVLEHVLRTRGITAEFRPVSKPYYMQGRAAEVLIENVSVGYVGELHPEVLENFGLATPVGAFEISLEILF